MNSQNLTTLQTLLDFVGDSSLLIKEVATKFWKRPLYLHLWVEQIYAIGVLSFPLIVVVALSTGMVMSLEFGMGLEKFGGKPYVPKIVSLSIIRELGPVFTCLLLAARVGAGMASEIASMAVSQQLDAMRALGTSPMKKVIIPRIMACVISFPILVIIANTLGVLGAAWVGASELGLDPQFFLQKVRDTIGLHDYLGGLIKPVFFSFFVSLPACIYGLNVEGGTQGVGRATTKAVVTGSILVVIGDFFIAKFLWILDKWL